MDQPSLAVPVENTEKAAGEEEAAAAQEALPAEKKVAFHAPAAGQ
jgi:hypothetical protein